MSNADPGLPTFQSTSWRGTASASSSADNRSEAVVETDPLAEEEQSADSHDFAHTSHISHIFDDGGVLDKLSSVSEAVEQGNHADLERAIFRTAPGPRNSTWPRQVHPSTRVQGNVAGRASTTVRTLNFYWPHRLFDPSRRRRSWVLVRLRNNALLYNDLPHLSSPTALVSYPHVNARILSWCSYSQSVQTPRHDARLTRAVPSTPTILSYRAMTIRASDSTTRNLPKMTKGLLP
ncbi:hypothetical protein CIB48_g9649 [Xylaria polymorpha]|nr:hypothetical protein CIB48_g9649 [Xylaria polymorpha]